MNTCIECFCGKKFSKKQMFSSHFSECQKIKNKFKGLDTKISRAIKKFVDNLDNSNEKEYMNGLLLLELFFKKYVYLLKEIINKINKVTNSKFNLSNKEIKINLNKNNKANNANNNINLNNQFMKKDDNIYINNTNDKNNNNISIKSNSNNKIIKNNINNMNNLIDKNNFNNIYNLNNFNIKNNLNNINNKNNINFINNTNNINYINNSNDINYVNIPNNMNNVNNAFNNNYVNNANTNNNNFMINTNNNYVNNTNNMNYINNINNNINNVNNMNNNMNYANIINNNMNNFKNMYYLNNNSNKNKIQKANNFSEIFKKANAQFTEMNMKKNKSSNNLLQSQEDLEEKITIIFKFLTDHQEKVKARLDELFYDVFKRFHETQCPPDLKNYMCYGFHYNKLIDNQKTLNENGIKNGDTILFNRIDENYKEEEVEEDNEEDEEEKKTLLHLWIKEYDCIVKNNLLLSNSEEKNKSNSTIRDYINKKFMELGIKTKEHEHRLIYCKTNFNWTCSECSFVDTKLEPRLFCSICNYNMCNNCRKNKKYYKIGNIPLSALPSDNKIKNYVINYREHEHRLIYCRTKRTSHNIVGWVCNKCEGKFTEKDWTFYCTQCDYDLCSNCEQNKNLI